MVAYELQYSAALLFQLIAYDKILVVVIIIIMMTMVAVENLRVGDEIPLPGIPKAFLYFYTYN